MENVPALSQSIWRHASIYCEVSDRQKALENLDPQGCSGIGWADKCNRFMLTSLIVNKLPNFEWQMIKINDLYWHSLQPHRSSGAACSLFLWLFRFSLYLSASAYRCLSWGRRSVGNKRLSLSFCNNIVSPFLSAYSVWFLLSEVGWPATIPSLESFFGYCSCSFWFSFAYAWWKFLWHNRTK